MRLFCGALVLFSGPIMSLIPRTLPGAYHILPVHNPGPPEHYVCGPEFGHNIVPLDCQMAVETNWPRGDSPIHYYFRDPSSSNSIRLPLSDHQGSCTVSLESAGPGKQTVWTNSEQQSYFSVSPNKLRGLAGFLIQTCAQESNGIGGFMTLGFSAAGKWISSLAKSEIEDVSESNGTANAYDFELISTLYELDGRPNDGSFLTISISNPSGFQIRPGDTDPAVAATLSNHAYNLSMQYPSYERSARKEYFEVLAMDLRYKAESMTRGRSDGSTWWEDLDEDDPESVYTGFGSDQDSRESTASTPDKSNSKDGSHIDGKGRNQNLADGTNSASDMTYQCDAHLGAPSATDCEQLAWSGLKPATSIETLRPNIPNIYTQGTCALGISSSTAITITWAHLLAAFDTLNNLCVQNPYQGVHGGRAFYGVQGLKGSFPRKKRSLLRRRDADEIRGNDALPAGINATVWRHDGTAGRGSLECEWTKAAKGLDVGGCSGD